MAADAAYCSVLTDVKDPAQAPGSQERACAPDQRCAGGDSSIARPCRRCIFAGLLRLRWLCRETRRDSLDCQRRRLGRMVQLLLTNFGILSSRRPHKDGCWHIHVDRQIAPSDFQRKSDLASLASSRPSTNVRRHLIAGSSMNLGRRSCEIEHREADVYDISVEETHRYAAGGLSITTAIGTAC